jgi:integrase
VGRQCQKLWVGAAREATHRGSSGDSAPGWRPREGYATHGSIAHSPHGERTRGGGPAVFSGYRGNALASTTVEAALRRACDRLNLPRLTPHGLRHLHASILLHQGLSIPEVSKRLGHASPAITMSVYAHDLGESDANATDAIARVLAGQTASR